MCSLVYTIKKYEFIFYTNMFSNIIKSVVFKSKFKLIIHQQFFKFLITVKNEPTYLCKIFQLIKDFVRMCWNTKKLNLCWYFVLTFPFFYVHWMLISYSIILIHFILTTFRFSSSLSNFMKLRIFSRFLTPKYL